MWKSFMPTHSGSHSHGVLKNICMACYAFGVQSQGTVSESPKEGCGWRRPLLCKHLHTSTDSYPWEPPRLGARSFLLTSTTASIWPHLTWTWPPGPAQRVCSSNYISVTLTLNDFPSQKLWEYLKVHQYLLKFSHLKGIHCKPQDWFCA